MLIPCSDRDGKDDREDRDRRDNGANGDERKRKTSPDRRLLEMKRLTLIIALDSPPPQHDDLDVAE